MTPSAILEQYKIVVNFLGETLGPDYEIVLQDLTAEDHAIIAIANGYISGRTVGSPLTDAALKMLQSKTYENQDFLCNYKGVAKSGHILRSSTMFIKDGSGTPIGLLCINFDDSRFAELQEKMNSLIHPLAFRQNTGTVSQDSPPASSHATEPESIMENFSMDIPALMQRIYEDSAAGFPTPADRLNQSERREIISRLNEQGLFQLKGSVSFAARKLSCSTATIYRYLSELAN